MERRRRERWRGAAVAAIAAAALGGCAGGRTWVAPDYAASRPRLVAVLPVVNLAGTPLRAPDTSLVSAAFASDAPVADLARRLVANVLAVRGYRVQDLGATDRLLAAAVASGRLEHAAVDAALGVDAIAEVRFTEWNAEHLVLARALGVGLEVEVRRAGRPLFHGETRGVHDAAAGVAAVSFRPHLVEAVDRAMRRLP